MKKNREALLLPSVVLQVLFFLLLLPDISHAAPTHSSSLPPSQNASSTIPPSETTAIQSTTPSPFSPYCNGIVDDGGLYLDDTAKAAILSALQQYRKKHPEDKLSRCIIKTPDGHAIDEAISSFNAGKLQSEINNTAFLLLGKGVRTSDENPAESCHLRSYRFAGDQTAPLSAIQNSWENSYQVKESVTLAAGQKLIGIPLNINDNSLAEGFYVNLRRIISGQIQCARYGTNYTGFAVDKDNLITLSEPGIVVSGLTNVLDLNEKATLTGTCISRRRYRSYSKSHQGEVDAYRGYQELIKAELDPKAVTPEQRYFYKITGNEFFQVQSSAVDIAFRQGTNRIDSSRMDNMKAFVLISNNRFYACHKKVAGQHMEPVLTINTYFEDDAQSPEFINALELSDNQLMTKGGTAIHLTTSPRTKSTLSKNHLVTSGLTISDSRGIKLTGANRLEDTTKPRPEFTLEHNTIKAFQDALLLDGALVLTLNSNRLKGRESAIARVPGQLTDLVTLSGNKQNRHLTTVTLPCAGLELSSTAGGFLFADKTPCPVNYSPSGDSP